MLSVQTPQETVEQIISDLANCPADLDLDTATHFQFVTQAFVNEDLTRALCCEDTYDVILTIEGENWLLIDEGNGYSYDFVGSGDLLFGWTDANAGQGPLTDAERESLQSGLESELPGVTVVNRELTTAESQWQEPFVNQLERIFYRALNNL